MKKYLTIVGNRPQLIKLDPTFNQVLVFTGQHYDGVLKDVFFKGLNIPKPDYDLGETELGSMIDKLMVILQKEVPDYVIVYGDTRSTLAGALAALYNNIAVVHIEAGCRSFNDKMIEERIRKIVDEIAVVHFAPSENCKEYLERNNKNTSVYNVGATQIDAMYSTFPTKKPKDAGTYIVATIHRESNTDIDKLSKILKAFGDSCQNIRLYIHPRTEKVLLDNKINVPKNIKILKPLPYKEMINTMAFASKIVTDSGGIQVEAFFLKVPCITLRDETEWIETVEQGWNKLVGADENKIVQALTEKRPRGQGDLYCYGGGDARRKIKMILENL
jgi:UDP-GlcNAc3NAcA epimerase